MINLNQVDILKLRSALPSLGFARLPASLDPLALASLQEEVGKLEAVAKVAEQSEGLKYRASIASLGPHARFVLCSTQMTDLLSQVFGGRFVLTEDRSCLTIYKEGDHLGPHLDKPAEECVVTIIIYVAVTRQRPQPRASTGLELHVYGKQMVEDGKAQLTIPTDTGAIVIGYGSRFWHERPQLQEGEQVAALTGCYRYAASSEEKDREQAAR